MSISRIFNHAPTTTINTHWDQPNLLALRLVSKETQADVNNFFRRDFFDKHPHLAKFNVFPTLRLDYPNRCWTIAHRVFSQDNTKLKESDLLKGMDLTFFAEGAICDRLQSKSQGYGFEIKKICGSRMKDPNSFIHQAWEALELKEKEQADNLNNYNLALKNLGDFHSEPQMRQILGRLYVIAASEEDLLKQEMVNLPFLQEQLPLYIDTINMMRKVKKLSIEFEKASNSYSYLEENRKQCAEPKKKREICGSHFQDLKSPIHQAFIALSLKNREMKALEEESKNFLGKIYSIHPKNEIEEISLKLAKLADFHRSGILEKEADQENSQFLRKNIPIYSNLLHLIQQNFSLIVECKTLKTSYYDIEKKRKNYVVKKEKIEDKIALFKACHAQFLKASEWIAEFETYQTIAPKQVDAPTLKDSYFQLMFEYRQKLQQELFETVQLEKRLIRCSGLQQCVAAVEKAINKPHDDLYDQIRSLVNSLGSEDRTFIWKNLYDKCAGGRQELTWSEKHFPKFLPQLKSIAKELLESLS